MSPVSCAIFFNRSAFSLRYLGDLGDGTGEGCSCGDEKIELTHPAGTFNLQASTVSFKISSLLARRSKLSTCLYNRGLQS